VARWQVLQAYLLQVLILTIRRVFHEFDQKQKPRNINTPHIYFHILEYIYTPTPQNIYIKEVWDSMKLKREKNTYFMVKVYIVTCNKCTCISSGFGSLHYLSRVLC
jgi:hypothetical protein